MATKYLYKLLPKAPPSPLPKTLPLSPLDTHSGFIHLSTPTQVPRTAARFFSDKNTIYLLMIPLSRLGVSVAEGGKGGEVKWESSGSGGGSGLFAHLYGAGLGAEEVVDVLVRRRWEGERWEGVLGGLE